MTAKINYFPGELINGIKYLEEFEDYISPSGNKSRSALFECPFCKKKFKTVIARAKNGHTKSCGCWNIKSSTNRATKHGLSSHKLFKVWCGIKKRCYNDSGSNEYYRDKGIKMCDGWKNDFKVFYDWAIKNGWKDSLTIDRINGEKNYMPSNCRFTNKHVQSVNKRMQKNNTSGYVGVVFNKRRKKWESGISIKNKRFFLGYFSNKVDSVIARDKYITKHKLWEYKLQVLKQPQLDIQFLKL